MATLDELARSLGGELESRRLSTQLGGYRVFIWEHATHLTNSVGLDIAVCPDDMNMVEVLGGYPWWSYARPPRSFDAELPRLRHGFVFSGSVSGALYASSVGTPSSDDVVATLWELISWARRPPGPSPWPRLGPRARSRHVRSVIVALLVALCVWLLRRR